MSSTRVKVVIVNPYDIPVTCAHSDDVCSNAQWDNMPVGTVIAPNTSLTFTSESNNRLFCEWTNKYGAIFQMAVTNPEMSDNSACGITVNAGLQQYSESGTPVTYTFKLGTSNLADWDSGTENNGNVIDWGSCSN